jgi:hypothetical protein
VTGREHLSEHRPCKTAPKQSISANPDMHVRRSTAKLVPSDHTNLNSEATPLFVAQLLIDIKHRGASSEKERGALSPMPVCPAAAPLQELEEGGNVAGACQTSGKQHLQEHGRQQQSTAANNSPESGEECQTSVEQPQHHSPTSPPAARDGYSADGEGEASAPGWHRDKKIRAAKRAARSELSVSRGDW